MYTGYQCKLIDRLVSHHIDKIPMHDVRVKKVTHGDDHILILTTTGEVHIIIPDYTEYSYDLSIPKYIQQHNIIDIVSGSQHNMVLTDTNQLYAWGSNTDGQGKYVGQCDIPEVYGNIVSIAAGTYYSACVDDTGRLYVWGDNSDHQITDAIKTNVRVVYSGGEGNIFCLDNNNRLISWGRKEKNYQIDNVQNFYSGEYHHFVEFIDGTVGSIGTGTTNEMQIPVGSNIKQIAVGGELPGHTLVLYEDGTLTGYGNNNYCQISPVALNCDNMYYVFKNKWKYISTGMSWSVGVTIENKLLGWGIFGVDY